jgi:hypothetical protein
MAATGLAHLRDALDRAVADLHDEDLAAAIAALAGAQARILLTRIAMPARDVAPPADELVDAAEMARRASMPEHWVRDQGRRWRKTAGAEGIPCVKRGHYVRFEPAAVLEAIRSNRMTTPAQVVEINCDKGWRGRCPAVSTTCGHAAEVDAPSGLLGSSNQCGKGRGHLKRTCRGCKPNRCRSATRSMRRRM